METILNNIVLIDPLTEDEFTVPIGILNGIRFEKLEEINKSFRNIKQEIKILLSMMKNEPEKLKALIDANPQMEILINYMLEGKLNEDELISLVSQQDTSVSKNNQEKRIEIIKVMINMKQITDVKILDYINSAWNSDFWKSQNIITLGEVADSFRKLLSK